MTGHDPSTTANAGLALLVLRCQTGDERAFARLLDQFGGKTLGYLRGLVGDAAEDVQQEVWLTVYRSIATLASPRAFRTWLFRIARHRALDLLRRQHRERELMADAALEADGHVAVQEDTGLEEWMLDALDQLSPAHREVCLLRYRDDMSYAEIALIVGNTVGTVRSRLHYAKQRLHELLEHER